MYGKTEWIFNYGMVNWMNFSVWPTIPPSLEGQPYMQDMYWLNEYDVSFIEIYYLLPILPIGPPSPGETEGVVTWHHAVLASVNPPDGRSQYQHHNRVRDPMCAMSQRQVEGAPTDTNQKGWSRSWKRGLGRTLKKSQMSNSLVFKVFSGGFWIVISEFGV